MENKTNEILIAAKHISWNLLDDIREMSKYKNENFSNDVNMDLVDTKITIKFKWEGGSNINKIEFDIDKDDTQIMVKQWEQLVAEKLQKCRDAGAG